MKDSTDIQYLCHQHTGVFLGIWNRGGMAQIYIKNIKKYKNDSELGGGVDSQLGVYLPPLGSGVKISLDHWKIHFYI